jgi:hypothetical protein
LVLADQKTCPPSLCEFITLITYQLSPVTLRLSCWPLACLPLAYPSRHHFIEGCWLINIRDSVFLFHSTVAPIISFLSAKIVSTKVSFTPPPLGLVTHFSLYSTLFTFLTSFSQLASLPVCTLCCLCCPCAVLGELD